MRTPTDTDISIAAARMLAQIADTESHRIKIRVDHGIVTIEGTVGTNPERKNIENNVRNLTGVQGIVNCLCIHQTPK
ncbi:BON domain-containing protein [Puia sp. P3]|uniref:BON domain-containing protein n=1 Tax=Puia sp. P3 TaxID=3423952 RepID=UPI003D67C36A